VDLSHVSLCVMPWGVRPATPAELIAVAQHAERLGFYALTLAFRPMLPTPDEPPAGGYVFQRVSEEFRHYQHDPLVLAPMLLQATSHLRVGFNVLITPWLHPFVWAKYLASLDAASDGRVVAGLGIGYVPSDEPLPSLARLGLPSDHRGARSDEALEIMTRLWTESAPLTYRGRYYQCHEVALAPRPARTPYVELWWAGQTEVSCLRAARYARFLELARPSRRAIRERYGPWLRAANERVNGRAEIAAMLNGLVRDRDLTPDEGSAALFGWTPETIARLPIGGPERCAAALRDYREAGVRHFVLDFHRHGLDPIGAVHEQMERFAADVLPRV
jgi:alkanesulfonate monooxygenase SsuD/methylene tetrahydromethanopterin reductase-like flavin-dependent oxidoreductase (luciferase family)